MDNTFTKLDIENIIALGFNNEQINILQDAATRSPEGSDKEELILDIKMMIEKGMLPETIIQELKKKMTGMTGGRRHKGSKKMHKNKRHGNASLRAWVTFVKKVQKEEGIGYKEAMSVAKKRKDGGEKWRGGSFNPETGEDDEDDEEKYLTEGGRRRRRTQRRSRSRSRSHKRSRRHRRSRRHH